MNYIQRNLFWILTIALGFLNPLISVGLIILYYLPRIVQDMCKSCNEVQNNPEMNFFSDDVMEEMK